MMETSMTEQRIRDIFEQAGAIITDSHIVYTSGKHGSAYVNKDAVYPDTKVTSDLCRAIAEQFADDDVEVVIAPAIGGVILSQWVAHHLSEITGHKVFGVYAEYEESFIMDSDGKDILIPLPEGTFDRENEEGEITLHLGEKLVVKKPSFVIKRGYDKIVANKNVLTVEDVLTTGGSAKKVIEVTRTLGGNIVGLGVLCNRGGITPKDLANPLRLFSLVNVTLDAWNEADCPLCKQGIPFNTDVGKARQFAERLKRENRFSKYTHMFPSLQ